MTLSVFVFELFGGLFQASRAARKDASLVGLWQDRDPRGVGDPYQEGRHHHHHQQPATRAEGHDSSIGGSLPTLGESVSNHSTRRPETLQLS